MRRAPGHALAVTALVVSLMATDRRAAEEVAISAVERRDLGRSGAGQPDLAVIVDLATLRLRAGAVAEFHVLRESVARCGGCDGWFWDPIAYLDDRLRLRHFTWSEWLARTSAASEPVSRG